MKIVLTGAGSGGHITPLLAVAAELKKLEPDSRLVYVGQSGDKLGDIPARSQYIDEVYTIRAGKFRRYHGEGLRQLFDIKTWLLNIRDFFHLLIGLWQSRRLLKQLQPDIIFIKGGFVGVPVGLAAARQHIPYVTHDSDAVPGLANRIIARWASKHAVALPPEQYKYPADKTFMTGIPLRADFKPVDDKLMQKYRQELDIPARAKLIFVVGGGLGSKAVNRAVGEAVPHLLREFPDLYVVQAAGRANAAEMTVLYDERLNDAEQGRLRLHDFIDDVYRQSGAADLVITRAGATNLAEFALQGKACVVVPSAFLAAGHQLKNASYLSEAGAAVVLGEDDLTADPNRLAKVVSHLLDDNKLRQNLGRSLSDFAVPNAAHKLAQLILNTADEAKA